MATPELHALPAAAELPVPLPPPAPPPRGRPSPRRRRILDATLAGVVVVFGFLAASFVARNGDLWQHLAAGRLLAGGEYHFGTDPFAYTTEGVYWANHSWLFDWLLHALFVTVGGAVLVVLKALVVAALAWLMLRFRRPGGGLAAPVACTLLALLALSPRLPLQPAVLSYFLLGLTLWLLWRARTVPGKASRRFGPLLAVCVLWVNLDEWFLLGPVLIALFWLGERLQPLLSPVAAGLQPADSASAKRIPGWLLPTALVACLLNPHHVHAFTLPAELSPVLAHSGLRQDMHSIVPLPRPGN